MIDDNKITEILTYLNETSQTLRVSGFDYTYSVEIKFSYYADSKRVSRQYLIVKWNGSKLYSKNKIAFPIIDSLNLYAEEEITNMEIINKKAVAGICKEKNLKKHHANKAKRKEQIEHDKEESC